MVSMRLFDQKVSSVKSRGAMYDKLDEMDTIVRNNFPSEIDDDTLFDSVAKGYISGIQDPYAEYLNADQIALRNEQDNGSITSVGVDTVKDATTGYLLVTKVYRDSAADVAGIVEGDSIIKINDVQVSGITYEEASNMLLGEEGEAISITYAHETTEKTIDLDFTTYELEALYYLRVDDVSYIRFTRDFNNATVSQFRKALDNVSISTDKGLVIDLRNIGGGTNLKYTADMLDLLLPSGSLIIGQFGENNSKVLYNSDPSFIDLPIVVLINKNTNGYSELMAAVIRDYAGNYAVGEQTSGIGMNRVLYQMSDGTGIVMSSSKLTTPKGTTYDINGVMPDYPVEMDFAAGTAHIQPDRMMDIQYKKALDIFDMLYKEKYPDGPPEPVQSEESEVTEGEGEELAEGAEETTESTEESSS